MGAYTKLKFIYPFTGGVVMPDETLVKGFYFMVKINKNDILSYKIINLRYRKTDDYSKGGFYMIKHIKSGKSYIGKSIDYMARLKQHTYISNKQTTIDVALKGNLNEFEFYLIFDYKVFNIDYFNRKLETIIEQKLIQEYKTYTPNGFNVRYYGHI